MSIDYRAAWQTIINMVNDFLAVLPKLVLAGIVFALFYLASKWVGSGVQSLIHRRKPRRNLELVLSRLAQWLVVGAGALVALAIAFPSFQAKDLITMLGVGGVAIGFAFRDVFQNFLSGILLLITEPFRIGDTISINNVEGVVEQIETRATMIQTPDHRRVVVPNATLFTNSVMVLTAYDTRRWEQEVSLPREHDTEQAKQRMIEVIRSVDGVLPEPPPQVYVIKLEDANVRIRVLWWTKSSGVDAVAITDLVLTRVKDALVRPG